MVRVHHLLEAHPGLLVERGVEAEPAQRVVHAQARSLRVLLRVALKRQDRVARAQQALAALGQRDEVRGGQGDLAPVVLLQLEGAEGGGFREELPPGFCEVHGGYAHLREGLLVYVHFYSLRW